MKLTIQKQFFFARSQNGYSLVEIMIAVAIIGILAGAVVINNATMRPTRNMHSYGRDLLSAVQLARLDAIRNNTCMGIFFDIPNGSYWIFTDDGTGAGTACDAVMDPAEQGNALSPARQVTVPDGVTIAQSPVAATFGTDPNYRLAGPPPDTDLFDSISFDSRSLVAARVWNGVGAITLRNDLVVANATWWGRIIVTPSGSVEYQTNNNPVNQGNWSR